jgi:hypothetical protein
LRELAGRRPRYGYRRLTVMQRRQGWKVNTKRVYQIYRKEHLGVQMAKRKKRGRHLRVPLFALINLRITLCSHLHDCKGILGESHDRAPTFPGLTYTTPRLLAV